MAKEMAEYRLAAKEQGLENPEEQWWYNYQSQVEEGGGLTNDQVEPRPRADIPRLARRC